MLRKIIVMTAIFSVLIGCAQAAAPTATTTAPVATDAAPATTHTSRDATFRTCKKEADSQRLGINERSAFIANCVKKTPQ